MDEESTTSQLPLALCFKLGRALRYGDVNTFFKIYDALAPMEDSGVSDATFQLQQATLKETARQISELDTDDYTVLAKATGPIQTCSESINLFEPVAIQLAQYIERCHLEERGSDSGTVSDYESQGCDIVESIQCVDFDTSMLNRRSLERSLSNRESLLIEEDIRTRNMTHRPSCWGIDSCKLAPQMENNQDNATEEDPLCSTDPGEEICKLLLEESLRRPTIDHDDSSMESGQTGYLPGRNIDSSPIEVSELEKTFFGTNSDDDNFAESMCSHMNSIPSSQSENLESIEFRMHWKSQLHLRGLENWDSTLGYPVYRIVSNCQRISTNHQIRNGNQFTESANSTSVNLSHFVHQSKRSKLRANESSSTHQESCTKNRTEGLQGSSKEWQCQESPQQHQQKEQQVTSPLALHSQNMWSSLREGIVNPSRIKRNHQRHTRYRNRNKDFNHHEIVQFLMQGWENALTELSAQKKSRL